MERPVFRTDLVSQPIDDGGQRFVDVTDPDSGSTFRFYEVEYAVACAMDGRRDLEGLVDWARAELGLEPTHDELETVISTLGDLGYLASQRVSDQDIALGAPGKSPLTPVESPMPPIETEDFDLGFAGKSPLSEPRAERPPAVDVELGSAGGSGDREEEVSVDLSRHLEIGTEDVKEAVRQSQVMTAVELPEELRGDGADEAPPAPALGAPDRPSPAPAPSAPAEATPIVLPSERADISGKFSASLGGADRATAAEAVTRPGKSSTLVWLLVLLVVVLGAVAYYWYAYLREDAGRANGAPNAAEKAAVDPSVPPSATLRPGSGEEAKVVAAVDGEVAWLEEAGASVEEGAAVAKLAGFPGAERAVADLRASRNRSQDRLDKATAAGDKAGMQRHDSELQRKEAELAQAEEALSQLILAAPAAGVVEPLVKKAAEVKAGDAVARVSAEVGPEARFAVADPARYQVGASVQLVAKDDSSSSATCTVAEVADAEISVTCPVDTGLAPGTAVLLK